MEENFYNGCHIETCKLEVLFYKIRCSVQIHALKEEKSVTDLLT